MSLIYFCHSYLELFRGISSLPLTLSWFVMECLWKISCVVYGEFFKHIWETFLIGDSNPDNHNCLILCFHIGAYNDPRCVTMWFAVLSKHIWSILLQFSHHYVHIFTVTYFNLLLLFEHSSFIACKAFGCFKPRHWVPFQQLNVPILFVFL